MSENGGPASDEAYPYPPDVASKVSALRVPEIPEDCDVLRAGIAYAEAGWYVGPCDQKTKHPGGVLGKGWPLKTSNDPKEIAAWFAGTDHGLFLHVGRSGAVVLDVDKPDALPDCLTGIIRDARPPFQSTRSDDPARGHYVFAQDPDRLVGNGAGQLGKAWGEVRGANGIIIVQPTLHEKDNGRYLWVTTGDVPYRQALTDLLPDATDSADPATDATVKAFIAAHQRSEKPALMRSVVNRMKENVEAGGSRHDACRDALLWSMREAYAGQYPAKQAVESIWTVFERATKAETGRFIRSEFSSLLGWAVAQALLTDPEERRAEVQQRVAEIDFLKRAPMPLVLNPDTEAPPKRRDPDDYFHDKAAGIDVELLGQDVIAQGPLRVGRDNLFWEYKGGVWREQRDEVRGRCVDMLRGRYRGSHASNTEHVVRRKIGHIEGDPVPDYVNFRGDMEGHGGGMLDWRSGELHPHSPDYLSTVQVPLPWQPGATCERFDRFLESVLTPDYVELVWEMLGYLLMSGNPLQQAFLFYGTGQNGKGTVMRVITALLGRENISAVSLDALNGNRFAAAALYGKTANLAGDIDATYQESTAAFKSLTGEDVYSTEYKHQDAFTFTSWAVPVFSANEVPGSADVSEGYLRRWTVIHFGRHITEAEKIEGLSDLLIEELPGIAAKAVDSLRTLMVRGHFDKTRGDVAEGMKNFADRIDQVRQWVEQMCVIEGMSTTREKASDVYASYRAWAEATGSGKLSAEKFYGRLAGIGYPLKKVQGARFIQGLHVVDQRFIDPLTADRPNFFTTSAVG